MALKPDFGWLLLVSFLFGFANAISHGSYLDPALILVASAIGVLAWRFAVALAPLGSAAPVRHPERVVVFALLALASMPITAFFDPKLVVHAVRPWTVGRASEIVSLLLLASYVPWLRRKEPRSLARARFLAFAGIVLLVGVHTIHVSPHPDIDVWTIQMRGAEALLRGENPYSGLTVPDTDPESNFSVPYVYPPSSVLSGVIGIVLGGDVRYALLLAILVAGFSIRAVTRGASEHPSFVKDAPALFFWLSPTLFFILELSWLDPLQVALIGAGLALHVRGKPYGSAALFGLAASSKQSMFWLVPIVGLALRFDRKAWLTLFAAAAAPVLPFLVWDFRGLKYGNFDFMTSLRPRSDALAFAPWFAKTFGRPWPAQVAFVLAFATVGVTGCRMRGSFRMATALTLTYAVFFFFNKWAFANYYFLLTALATLAAATSLAPAAESGSPSAVRASNRPL